MSRKTFDVSKLVTLVNELLKSPLTTPEERRGAYQTLEGILFATDNYHGYNYLPSEWNDNTSSLRNDYDSTRRFYSYPVTR